MSIKQTAVYSLSFTLSILCSSLPAVAQTSLLPGDFDKYVEKVLQTFEVPGLSVAIVKDGKLLMAKGYGVKKLGSKDPVDAHTLFSIASNSKAFTATALAILIEEGKLKWDDRVIDHLPWFKMSDDYVTAHLTVRDLLVHQSGLQSYSGDLMLFPPSNFTRREILDKLKLLPIVHDFRTTYAYDNILYLAAGEIIKARSGQEWEDFIKTRIFNKVGMPSSASRYSEFKTKANISAAHYRLNGAITLVDHYMELNIGDASNPAGGILSNAADIANWMITQLDSGRTPTGSKLFKPTTTNELWKIVRPIPVPKFGEWLKPAQMDFFGYALGFRAYNYQKYKVVGHGGKLNGFVSQIAMVPEMKLGIAVFTNQESGAAYWSLIYYLLDHFEENKKMDWIRAYKYEQDSSFAELKTARLANVVKADSAGHFDLPLKKLAGHYRDTIYGDVTITPAAKGFTMEFKQLPHLVADLEYFQYNTFIARFRNKSLKADSYATFSLKENGGIETLKLKIIDPDSDLSFHDVLLKPLIAN